MKLSKDLKEFVELLNSRKVEFLVVGAHALAWHGLPRYTKDIDFFVGTNPENAKALELVIHDFGFSSTGLTAGDFQNPGQIIQLGIEPNRIDILTGISGVTWDEAWATRVKGEMDGVPVFFLSEDAYIRNKLASGRPQDIADAERLKKILGKE
jgi:hypothetical protein